MDRMNRVSKTFIDRDEDMPDSQPVYIYGRVRAECQKESILTFVPICNDSERIEDGDAGEDNSTRYRSVLGGATC